MITLRLPDGNVAVSDGQMFNRCGKWFSFLSYFDKRGIKRVTTYNPENHDYKILGHIDMDFRISDMTPKIYKILTKKFK